eukprot:6200929-Pleurochrysis_carterae.AAC.1
MHSVASPTKDRMTETREHANASSRLRIARGHHLVRMHVLEQARHPEVIGDAARLFVECLITCARAKP